jgi:hypothetical protein
LEASQNQAAAKVVARAKPESADFAKLVTWVSRSAIQPGPDERLLFRPQVRRARADVGSKDVISDIAASVLTSLSGSLRMLASLHNSRRLGLVAWRITLEGFHAA